MNLLSWLAGRFSSREKAMTLYRRGMAKAKKRDHQGAIDAYTTSLNIADTPGDIKAMVLYNRALVYVAAGDPQRGVDDLESVLAMKDVPVNVKTMAKQKRARIETHPANGDA